MLFRLIAPTMFGSIYTWSLSNVRDKTLGFPFNQYFPFLFLSLMGFGGSIFVLFFPSSLNEKLKVNKDDEEINLSVDHHKIQKIDGKITSISMGYFTQR